MTVAYLAPSSHVAKTPSVITVMAAEMSHIHDSHAPGLRFYDENRGNIVCVP